jgi:hypothetical protein
MFAAAGKRECFGIVKAIARLGLSSLGDGARQGSRLNFKRPPIREQRYKAEVNRSFGGMPSKNFGTRKVLMRVYLNGINDGKPFRFAPQYI